MNLWDLFVNWKRSKFGGKLLLHMRSGKTLMIHKVLEYDVIYGTSIDDPRIKELKVKFARRTVTRLIVKSVDLSQVEAVELK